MSSETWTGRIKGVSKLYHAIILGHLACFFQTTRIQYIQSDTNACSKPFQTSKMEFIAKLVYDFRKKLHLRCFTGSSIRLRDGTRNAVKIKFILIHLYYAKEIRKCNFHLELWAIKLVSSKIQESSPENLHSNFLLSEVVSQHLVIS